MKKIILPVGLRPRVVAAEDDFLVLEKPAGLLVHPADSAPNEPTLVDWLREKYPQVKKVGDDPEMRAGIVHRLDREASGLMVVALTQDFFEHVKAQFQAHTVTKIYSVLVYGRMINNFGEINLAIGRQKNSGRMVARPEYDEASRAAKTEYLVTARFGNATLLDVTIHTGRTHQIRVHLFSLNYPVVGDLLYHPKQTAKSFPAAPRLFLHAAKLAFTDLAGARREFTAPLPPELASYLAKFTPLKV